MSYETAGACRFLARGQIVFLVWVTFDKRKWVILAERRGRRASAITRMTFDAPPAWCLSLAASSARSRLAVEAKSAL
jgi:hypothetical protein